MPVETVVGVLMMKRGCMTLVLRVGAPSFRGGSNTADSVTSTSACAL